MPGITWEQDAQNALSRVPFFVRPMARKRIEAQVKQQGRKRVTLADFKQAEERFKSAMAGKSEAEIKRMMPEENRPGVKLVEVENCHNELADCHNVLIKTSEWKRAIRDRVRMNNINERLRERITADKVLFHHKFRVSISGCPNGCSRPQIADVGLTGFVRPAVDSSNCTACGACAKVCPDSAIAFKDEPPLFDQKACLGCLKCSGICPNNSILLSDPGVRILIGGKLGRHPHLGVNIGEAETPDDLISRLEPIFNDFIENAAPNERFADFWVRSQGRQGYE